jgi:SAM-dependent methyltransferase
MAADSIWELEHARLERAYSKRDKITGGDAFAWSCLRPEAHWLDFIIQQFLFTSLSGAGWNPQNISNCHLLEVGCGTGRVLNWCSLAGISTPVGIEALHDRALKAHHMMPNALIAQSDMGRLPFPDKHFDCAIQVLTFSCCLDGAVKSQAAREALRVIKDDGCVIWCDIRPGKSKMEYLKGIREDEVHRLFPGTIISFKKMGADPQLIGSLTSLMNQGLLRSLARRIPKLRNLTLAQKKPISKFPRIAASLFECLPLATCYLGAVIKKQKSAAR